MGRPLSLTVGVVLMLLVAACGGTSSSPTPTPIPTFGIGETFHAASDGWDLNVTDVATLPVTLGGIMGQPMVAKGVFLEVTVTLTNTGTKAHALGMNRFILHDGSGRQFQAAAFTESPNLMSDLSMGQTMNPGLSLNGVLSFDIPKDDSGLWLETIGKGHIQLGNVVAGTFAPLGSK